MRTPRMLLVISLIVAVVLSLGPVRVEAFNVPKDSGHNTADKPDEQDTDPENKDRDEDADPVDMQSGAFSYEHADFYIPGFGPELTLQRSYSSANYYDGPFGRGWHHNFDIFVIETYEMPQFYSVAVSASEAGAAKERERDQLYAGSAVFSGVNVRYGDGTLIKFNTAGGDAFVRPVYYYLTMRKEGDVYIMRDKSGTEFLFPVSATGGGAVRRLGSIRDRNGNSLTMAYDEAGRLSTVTDDVGRSLTLTYNDQNKVAAVTDPADRQCSYTYDDQGRLVDFEDPMGDHRTYAYNAKGLLTGITDPKGVTWLENEYDSDGRVIRQMASGGEYSFTYSESSSRTDVTYPDGTVWTHYYNDRGNPIDTRRPDGTRIERTWDERMNMLTERDSRGKTTTYTYDDWGNVLRIQESTGAIQTFEYEPEFNRMTKYVDRLGNVTRMTHDANGNRLRRVYPNGDLLEFTYNERGQMTSRTDTEGRLYQYEYNSHGYLSRVIDPLGQQTANTHDVIGRLLSHTDANGNTTTYEYDDCRQKVAETDALGNRTTFAYSPNGKQTAITNPMGETRTYVYDDYDNLTEETDPAGNATRFTYDDLGRVVAMTDAENHVTSYTYNNRGFMEDRLTSDGAVVHYEYDGEGMVTEITDENGSTTVYGYDADGHLKTIDYPDGTREQYTRNIAGLATRRTFRNGDTVDFEYDARQRVTTRTYSTGRVITVEYDGADRLVSAADGASTVTYAYDAKNRIVESSQSGFDVQFEYDSKGNRTAIIYPDGSRVSYVYDARNMMTEIRDDDNGIIALYTYDGARRRLSRTLANGAETQRTYDAAGRLASSNTAAGAETIADLAYTYDGAGNLLTRTDRDGQHVYAYDSADRLLSVDYPEGYSFSDTEYEYDLRGNRTTVVSDTTVSYASNALDQYTQVGSTSYSYDDNGNVTEDGEGTYTWDSENRLVSVSNDDHTTITYRYDPMGRRIEKNVDGLVTRYVYAGDTVIAEYRDAESVFFVPGATVDEPVRMTRGDTATYFHQDLVGSVVALTDAAGSVVERYRYDVFGEPDVTSSAGNPYLFQGRRHDDETGRYYFRARFYAPGIGRFLSPDSAANSDHLYAFVNNNPVLHTDPWGMAPGDSYPSQDAAANAAMSDIFDQSVRENREYGGWIYQNDDGTYSYTAPNRGDVDSVDPGAKPEGGTAYYHSHGGVDPAYDSENFSPEDRAYAEHYDSDGYVITPTGDRKRYDHETNTDEHVWTDEEIEKALKLLDQLIDLLF